MTDCLKLYFKVDAVERPRDQTTGMPKGFAFITFKEKRVQNFKNLTQKNFDCLKNLKIFVLNFLKRTHPWWKE